jgi:hypothetical protein
MKWDSEYCLNELARHRKNAKFQSEHRDDDLVMLDIWDVNFLLNLATDGVQAMARMKEISLALDTVYEKLREKKEAR